MQSHQPPKLRPDGGGVMQDVGYELPRIPVPRSWVNRGADKTPGAQAIHAAEGKEVGAPDGRKVTPEKRRAHAMPYLEMLLSKGAGHGSKKVCGPAQNGCSRALTASEYKTARRYCFVRPEALGARRDGACIKWCMKV
jgi:hypothetical protein